MCATKNYYEILGVDSKAEYKEIWKAFTALSRKLHSDITKKLYSDNASWNKENDERYKEITKAWDTLKDAERRKEYDESLFRMQNRERQEGQFNHGYRKWHDYCQEEWEWQQKEERRRRKEYRKFKQQQKEERRRKKYMMSLFLILIFILLIIFCLLFEWLFPSKRKLVVKKKHSS